MMFSMDMHCHFFPERFIAAARRPASPYHASVETRAGGQDYLVSPGNFDYPLTPELYDEAALLRDLDRRGISMAVLSIAPPALSYWAPAPDAERIARLYNENAADRVRRRPDRFLGMATVPLQDIHLAVAVLQEAVSRLGLRAAMIGSNVAGRNLDSPEFFPFFEAADGLGVSLFVHPYLPAGADRMQRYYLHNLVGMVSETGLAAASLIYGGVLERLPHLKVCLAHAGGTFPYIRGRLDHGYRVRPECRPALPHPPSHYLDRFYFDNITFEPGALRFLVDSVGADRIMLGSDYPFDMGPERPVEEVTGNALLTPLEQSQILGGTAREFFGMGPAPDL